MTLWLDVLIAVIAAEHIGFFVLEAWLWQKPIALKVFRNSAEFARESAVLAANQGLYNGFLAAGLIWAVFGQRQDVATFFLGCIVVAGVFGGITVSRRIIFVQALPALLGLLLNLCG